MTDTPSNTELLESIYAIFTDVRLGIEHNQPAKVYAENADKILALFQAQKQQLLDELVGELPKRVDVKPHDTGIDYYYAKGHDKALDQVVSVIESKRKGEQNHGE